MKILHVAETIKGGIASFLDELVPQQIRSHGADAVHLVIPDAHVADLRNVPASCITSFAHGPRRLANAAAMMKACNAHLRQHPVDILHAHSSFAGAATRLRHGWPGRRHKLVYTPHAWSFYRDSSGLVTRAYVLAERALAPLCDAIHCVSNHEAQLGAEVGLPAHKLKVVLNGIGDLPTGTTPDPAMLQAWPPGMRRVLYVGRFDRQKGIDRLAEIMSGLSGIAHAVVIGAAVSEDQALPPFADNVTLVGWKPRDKVAAYLHACELLLIPSRWEGLCVVGIEALRAGRPVFATNVGGMADLVLDQVNGRLVPNASATSLVEAIANTDSQALKSLGAAARNHYETHFQSGSMHNGLQRLYENILAND